MASGGTIAAGIAIAVVGVALFFDFTGQASQCSSQTLNQSAQDQCNSDLGAVDIVLLIFVVIGGALIVVGAAITPADELPQTRYVVMQPAHQSAGQTPTPAASPVRAPMPGPPGPSGVGQAFCPWCGTKRVAGAPFCSGCGKSLG